MLALTLSAWQGTNLPTVTGETYRYALDVVGHPEQHVRLSAQGVPPGWIAAFCTPTMCAPMQVRFTLSADGRRRFEFGLIRESGSVPPTMRITIRSSDGAERTVLISSKPHAKP